MFCLSDNKNLEDIVLFFSKLFYIILFWNFTAVFEFHMPLHCEVTLMKELSHVESDHFFDLGQKESPRSLAPCNPLIHFSTSTPRIFAFCKKKIDMLCLLYFVA